MLVTMKQLKMGMMGYLKNEVFPNVDASTPSGFGISLVSTLAVGYIDRFIVNLSRNPLLSMFEIIDEEGRVELDNFAEAIAFVMPETGVSVPIGKGSKLTFRPNDAQKLCEYIAR